MADEFTKPPEGHVPMGGLPHNGKKTVQPDTPKKTRKQLNKEAKEAASKSPTAADGTKKKKKEKPVDFSTQVGPDGMQGELGRAYISLGETNRAPACTNLLFSNSSVQATDEPADGGGSEANGRR